METRLQQCRACGTEIDLATGRCPFCPVPAWSAQGPGVALPPVIPAASSPAPPPAAQAAASPASVPFEPPPAERELERLTREQARRALEAARAALVSGWERKALLAVRRGLWLVPDDADLLALYHGLQGEAERREAARVASRAPTGHVRAGLELLQQGRLEESLRILRAVLREDPDNASAQAAIQEVRQAWLRRRTRPAETAGVSAPPPPRAASPLSAVSVPPRESAPPHAAEPSSAAPARPLPRPSLPVAVRPVGPPDRPGSSRTLAAAERPSPAIPAEILLPRSRRRATPLGVILASVALLAAAGFLILGRGSARPSAAPRAAAAPPGAAPGAGASPEAQTTPSASLAEAPRGALDEPGLDPELRSVVQEMLAAYAQALEAGDGGRLARARPDLPAIERQRRIAPFVGATNAAVDVRVLQVTVKGAQALVRIRRVDVIVGRQQSVAVETLVFARRKGEWALR